MESLVARLRAHWWVVALRGGLAVALAIAAFFAPFATIGALMWVAGLYFFADGVVASVAGIRAMRANDRWGWLVLEGMLGVCAGAVAWAFPGPTALAFVGLTAVWAIASGIVLIVSAARLRNEIEDEWTVGFMGAASIVLGVALVAFPAAGLVAWAWMLGVYALVAGVAMLAFAARLRALPETRPSAGELLEVALPETADVATVRTAVVGRVVRIEMKHAPQPPSKPQGAPVAGSGGSTG